FTFSHSFAMSSARLESEAYECGLRISSVGGPVDAAARIARWDRFQNNDDPRFHGRGCESVPAGDRAARHGASGLLCRDLEQHGLSAPDDRAAVAGLGKRV